MSATPRHARAAPGPVRQRRHRARGTRAVEALRPRRGPQRHLADAACREVHAVIGVNGAGKSTLMKLIGGYLTPTRGTVALDGAPVAPRDAAEAERRGIVLVHQEILLAPRPHGFTEHLPRPRDPARLAPRRARHAGPRRAPPRPARHGHRPRHPRGASVDRPAPACSDRPALAVEPRVIIFDEPTASLTPHETKRCSPSSAACGRRHSRALHLPPTARGGGLADRVTVLRDGRLIATEAATGLTPLAMAHLMVGRDMARLFPALPPKARWAAAAGRRGDLDVPGHASGSPSSSAPARSWLRRPYRRRAPKPSRASSACGPPAGRSCSTAAPPPLAACATASRRSST